MKQVVFLSAALLLAPLASIQATAKPAQGGSGQDRARMFTRRDRDGDGRLTREEFLTGQPDPEEAPKRFVIFDTYKDGVLSREEFVTGGKKEK